MAPRLPELQEHLDSAFRHWVGLLGCPVQHQELDSMIAVGLFQFSRFCGSVFHGMCGSRLDISWCQTQAHPGLSCYSCPFSSTSCTFPFLLPIEAVDEVMAMVMVISHRILERFGLDLKNHPVPIYVLYVSGFYCV